jgi:hypothetical protein
MLRFLGVRNVVGVGIVFGNCVLGGGFGVRGLSGSCVVNVEGFVVKIYCSSAE